MMNLGPHISIAKGFEQAVLDAVSIDANTFQFFTRNPRGGNAKDLDFDDLKKAKQMIEDQQFYKPLAHAPYTLNLCSKTKRVRDFGLEMMADDLDRMEHIPTDLYNFHPGSHTGNGVDKGIQLIVDGLNEVMFDEMTTIVLLETMSGKGTEIGRSFEEIKRIIDGVERKDHIGVCLDTCHIYSAGYDYINHLDEVIEEFDEIIGLDYLKAIHLNDSKKAFNSNKDRHEKLGQGEIGLKALMDFIFHPKLKHLPVYLETPNELEGYKKEIITIKEECKKHE